MKVPEELFQRNGCSCGFGGKRHKDISVIEMAELSVKYAFKHCVSELPDFETIIEKHKDSGVDIRGRGWWFSNKDIAGYYGIPYELFLLCDIPQEFLESLQESVSDCFCLYPSIFIDCHKTYFHFIWDPKDIYDLPEEYGGKTLDLEFEKYICSNIRDIDFDMLAKLQID